MLLFQFSIHLHTLRPYVSHPISLLCGSVYLVLVDEVNFEIVEVLIIELHTIIHSVVSKRLNSGWTLIDLCRKSLNPHSLNIGTVNGLADLTSLVSLWTPLR